MKAVIEMTKGTNDKCEINKETGELFVDRKLSVTIPSNYGFLDNTLAADGDALDVFVLGPALPGLTELEVVPIAVFLCKDQGVEDHKILALPYGYTEEDLEKAVNDITTYLTSYKEGFKVIAYLTNPLSVLSVYKKSKIKTHYRHQRVNPWVLVGMMAFAGLLVLLDTLIRKL